MVPGEILHVVTWLRISSQLHHRGILGRLRCTLNRDGLDLLSHLFSLREGRSKEQHQHRDLEVKTRSGVHSDSHRRDLLAMLHAILDLSNDVTPRPM